MSTSNIMSFIYRTFSFQKITFEKHFTFILNFIVSIHEKEAEFNLFTPKDLCTHLI